MTGFFVKEASVTTFNTFTIDGAIRSGYYTEEEKETLNLGELSYLGHDEALLFFPHKRETAAWKL